MESRRRAVVRALLRFAGKTNCKVIAVFGRTPHACHTAVLYVRKQVPHIPVWLFVTSPPMPETRLLCQRVYVFGNPLALLLHAELRLWPQWVALSAATWTGERGGWPVKLAPFLIPPFRAVFLNDDGGFLSG